MAEYRTGNHQPQNVYRDDRYIGVMFTAEDAALVVEALTEVERVHGPALPVVIDISDLALRHAATKVRAARPGVEPNTALAVVQALVAMGWRPSALRDGVVPDA